MNESRRRMATLRDTLNLRAFKQPGLRAPNVLIDFPTSSAIPDRSICIPLAHHEQVQGNQAARRWDLRLRVESR